jgi:ankyrin repeat protein
MSPLIASSRLLALVFLVALTDPTAQAAPDAAVAPGEVAEFHRAAAAGNLSELAACLRHRPELVNLPLLGAEESHRETPLHVAVTSRRLEAAKLLLAAGAVVDPRSDGQTPLFRAAMTGQEDLVKLLLKHGADINGGTNPTDLADITPIRAAQLYGHLAVAQVLLEKGARIDLFSAAGLGWTTFIADRLEENPTLATLTDNWGSQAAWIALNTGQLHALEQLAMAGATLGGQHGNEGFTALHVAAERGYPEVAAFLVNSGLNINAPDYAGRTSLQYAIDHKQERVVAWLKAHGAR